MQPTRERLAQDLLAGRIDRRTFLRRAALLGLSLPAIQAILAACGGGSLSDEAPTATTASGAQATTAPAPTTGTSGATGATGGTGTGAASPVAAGSPSTGAGAGAAQVQRGGTVTIGSIQEPDSLMPYFVFLFVSYDVINMIFDKLIEVDENLNYVPEAALQVPTQQNGGISADGRTLTFKLRPNLRWHDGQPFTSADCKFTWETVMNTNFAVQSRAGWDNIEAVETPDATTVVYRLKKVDSTILQYFVTSGWMLPKHLLEGKDLNQSDFRRNPVGNGPFKFDQWQSGDFIRVVKNPDYWDTGKPYLDTVVYRTIPNTQGLLAALERKEVQVRLAMNFTDQEKVRAFQGFRVVETPSYSFFNFRNQCQMPITNEKLVRQALIYGLDRETICKTLLKGLVTPLQSLITPSSWAYNKDVPKYTFDQSKARALLDQAGWTLPGGQQVRQKGGQKLSFEIVNIAGDIERLQIVQAAQQMWAQIGVETSIKAIDAASFGPTMDSGYTVAYNFGGHDHEITNSQWLRKPNWPHFDNDRMYELIAQSQSTFDREERKKALFELQNLWADEQPELPVFARILFDAVATEIQNYKPTAPGSATTWNIAEWWLKK